LLQGKNSEELELVRTLCMVMEKVGGYEQLMNMTIPAFHEVYRYLQWSDKEQKKMANQARRKR